MELAELSCSTAMSAKEQKWLPSRRQSYRGNCIKVRRFLYQVPKVCYRDLENVKAKGNDLIEVTDALKLGKMKHVNISLVAVWE